MADSTFKTLLKNKLKAVFGAGEDSTGSLNRAVNRLATKTVEHTFLRRVGGALTNHVLNFAHTASKSMSQPIAEVVVYTADREGFVAGAYFSPYVSSTVTASASMSWSLLLTKRGGGLDTITVSNTFSVTALVAGLTSCTKKDTATPSISVSILSRNLVGAHCSNRLGLTSSATKKRLKRGDVLTARIMKGRVGHGDDSGAWFPGGKLTLNIEED